MDNEDYHEENDAATRRLLEAVCTGVELPTEEEELLVKQAQGDAYRLDDMPLDII